MKNQRTIVYLIQLVKLDKTVKFFKFIKLSTSYFYVYTEIT